MIEVNNLVRRFGDLAAVDDLSFRVADGEVFGFLGPNGAGKTTTVKVIVGMIAPTSGEVRLNGLTLLENELEVKRQIGYVPESCALYENLTGREHLEMICELQHLPPDKIDARINRLLELIDLKKAAGQRIIAYSKGMKQKLLLAGALIHNPKLLILDEPFSGLDANAQSVFKELIREFVRDGRIVIFCSHILEVVERVCTRLLIIDRGQKLAEGTTSDIIAAHNVKSLGEAFNALTGATDIDNQAHDILDALNGERD
ncbi:MAG: ABC transporter ATP-binding protein [bacterium]